MQAQALTRGAPLTPRQLESALQFDLELITLMVEQEADRRKQERAVRTSSSDKSKGKAMDEVLSAEGKEKEKGDSHLLLLRQERAYSPQLPSAEERIDQRQRKRRGS